MTISTTAARMAGYTREIFASSDGYDLNILIKPDVELAGCFKAFDLSEQEFVKINGWMCILEDVADKVVAQTTSSPNLPVKFSEQNGSTII